MVDKPSYYYLYFYPEIKHFFNKENLKILISNLLQADPRFFINFELNRQTGENDLHLCSLIRQDSIDEFIVYINKQSLSINEVTINPTLIEYASFYGSIQIFQYLEINGADLTEKCWLCGIHSNNPELIHLLEQKNPQTSYKKIYEEAIKCHHNDVANYIYDNLMNEDDKKVYEKSYFVNDSRNKYNVCMDEDINSYGYRFYNYLFFPNNFDNRIQFFYACCYDHINIVSFFLKLNNWNFNYKMTILNLIYFFIPVMHLFFQFNYFNTFEISI